MKHAASKRPITQAINNDEQTLQDSDSMIEQYEFTEPTMTKTDIENDVEFKYLAYDELTGDQKIDYRTLLLQEDFLIQNDRLYKVTRTRAKKLRNTMPVIQRLAVPKAFRLTVLERAHALNHYSGQKLYNTLFPHVYWADLYVSCHETRKHCTTCLEVRPNLSRQIPHLHPYSIPDACGVSIGFDYKDLCRPTENGFKAIGVFVDNFSGYCIFELTKDVSAASLGQAFIKRVLPLFSIPKEIYSDKGAALTSKLWKYICSLLQIKHYSAAALNPRLAGHTERAVKSLCEALAVLAPNDIDIEQYLPIAEMNVNCTANSSTGLSPFQLIRGCLPNLCLNSQPTAPPILTEDKSAFYEKLAETISDLHAGAKENLIITRREQKEQYARTHRTCEPTWKVGDYVMLQDLKIKPFSPQVITHRKLKGPYLISAIAEREADPDNPNDTGISRLCRLVMQAPGKGLRIWFLPIDSKHVTKTLHVFIKIILGCLS